MTVLVVEKIIMILKRGTTGFNVSYAPDGFKNRVQLLRICSTDVAKKLELVSKITLFFISNLIIYFVISCDPILRFISPYVVQLSSV